MGERGHCQGWLTVGTTGYFDELATGKQEHFLLLDLDNVLLAAMEAALTGCFPLEGAIGSNVGLETARI
jgi:hypothetical protein